jgi:hypothetical protein
MATIDSILPRFLGGQSRPAVWERYVELVDELIHGKQGLDHTTLGSLSHEFLGRF